MGERISRESTDARLKARRNPQDACCLRPSSCADKHFTSASVDGPHTRSSLNVGPTYRGHQKTLQDPTPANITFGCVTPMNENGMVDHSLRGKKGRQRRLETHCTVPNPTLKKARDIPFANIHGSVGQVKGVIRVFHDIVGALSTYPNVRLHSFQPGCHQFVASLKKQGKASLNGS